MFKYFKKLISSFIKSGRRRITTYAYDRKWETYVALLSVISTRISHFSLAPNFGVL
ncbi:Hypothetical predicted protein [Olea europaea subsp. europaea]|uniref:Uncharacterized protein n=1 Tax=Olea europaea subsp. europaea TaxID=158383 RepID=A0A8S0QED9_OLEEU|nr:Hypothetical predicted protein [Olea europaea subsp. europaea]